MLKIILLAIVIFFLTSTIVRNTPRDNTLDLDTALRSGGLRIDSWGKPAGPGLGHHGDCWNPYTATMQSDCNIGPFRDIDQETEL